MRVAVVTPYHREPLEVLERCHASVAAQSHRDVEHVLVADGHPRPQADSWGVHIHLPISHDDYGDTPRVVGAVSAAARGFDAIALLDADNWFEPDHLTQLILLQKASGADIVTATRNLRRLDGSLLGVCTESDGETFCDMNCYLFTRRAFGAIGALAFKDPRGGIVDDRILWDVVRRSNAVRAHSPKATVNYVTTFAVHYLGKKEAPPHGAKIIVDKPGSPFPEMILFSEFLRRSAGHSPDETP